MSIRSNIQTRFGKAVRAARLRLGLSQEKLAARAGLDRTYIGGIERGERNPALSSICKIAKALDIALPELFEGIPLDKEDE